MRSLLPPRATRCFIFYGFGDEHASSVLSNRLRQRQTSRPPVVVLDCDRLRDQREGSVDRMLSQRSDGWAYKLCRSLDAGAVNFEPPRVDPVISDQLERNEQDGSAVWFGGFKAATDQADEIMRWLGGRE